MRFAIIILSTCLVFSGYMNYKYATEKTDTSFRDIAFACGSGLRTYVLTYNQNIDIKETIKRIRFIGDTCNEIAGIYSGR